LSSSSFNLSVTNLNILVDGGTDATVQNRVVDFTKVSTDGTTFSPLQIPTGTSSSVTLDSPEFASKTIVVSGTVNFGVTDSTTGTTVSLSGSGAVTIAPATVYLTDNTTGNVLATPVTTTAYEVGVSGASATVTVAGQTAVFQGLTVGLAYYRSTTDSRSWMGPKTFGGSIQTRSSSSLLGVSNVQVSINKGFGTSNNTVVNFKKSYETATGLNDGAVLVDTGGPTPVRLDFATNVASAAASVHLFFGSYFYASGDFQFSSLGTKIVTLLNANGTTSTVNVNVKTLGVTDASVFVGNNGPYVNDDGSLNPLAEGFSLNGANFVVVEMTKVGDSTQEWDAVYASASS